MSRYMSIKPARLIIFLAAAFVLAGCSEDDNEDTVNPPSYSVDPATIDVSEAE